MITLPITQARQLALQSQGLLGSPQRKGKSNIINLIEHLGYVQIDTLAVVERAHHHTLWSRMNSYNSKTLDKLLKDKNIFEYWSHAASYLPMSDYRFSLPRKRMYLEGRSHWFKKDKKVMQYVLDRIRQEGPLRSKDFERTDKRKGAWYEWKPAKQALEQLFMEGTLMVAERQGFQKVYDLTERVLPSSIDTAFPTESEYACYLISKAVNAHGLVSENEITYLRKGWNTHVKQQLQKMLKNGELQEVKVEGLKDHYYTTAAKLAGTGKKIKDNTVHILSPFDNSLIQRKRVERLFDFSYQVECYVPEPKRIYGYFCLPLLFNDTFAGRLDPKADRASKTFYVHRLYIENDIDEEVFLPSFAQKLKEFAAFNGCDKIVIGKTDPKEISKELKSLLNFNDRL